MKKGLLFFVLPVALFVLVSAQTVAQPGNALAFAGPAGSNSITVLNGGAHPLDITGSITIETWLKPTRKTLIDEGNKWNTVMMKGSYGYGLVIGDDNCQPGSVGKVGYWGQNGCGQVPFSTTTIEYDRWNHVAVVISGGDLTFYINGEVAGTASGVAIPNGGAGSALYIGAQDRGSGGNGWYKGAMDELRIWNTARTAAEIQTGMYNGINAASAGLVAYYRFDHGTAGGTNTGVTTLDDQTANNLDGTLSNFTLTGTTSNFVESYAMVVPKSHAATGFNGSSFTANWNAPEVGTVTNYLLDVAADADFNTMISGYSALDVGTATSYAVTGLSGYDGYFYRVRADNTSVTGTGAKSGTISTFLPVAGLGKAVSLESARSEGVSVTNSSSLNFGTGSFTIEAWIKRPSGDGLFTIVGKQLAGSASANVGYYLRVQGNKVAWALGTSNVNNYAESTTSITDGNWHHIAASRDVVTKKMTIYIDGKLDAEASFTTARDVTSSANLGVGTKPGFGEYFNGTLDEVRIWSTARTQLQVKAYMNTPLSGNESGLSAYWNFESGVTAANDLSGNSNTGTLSGADGDEWTDSNPDYAATAVLNSVLTLRLGGSDIASHGSATARISSLPENGKLYQTSDGATKGSLITSAGTALTDAGGNPRRVIYEPNSDHTGIDNFSYQVNNGENTSANTQTVTITTEANNAPTLTGGTTTLATITEDQILAVTDVSAFLAGRGYSDSDAGALQGMAVTGATANGSWQYSLDGSTWTNFGIASESAALLLDRNTQIRFDADDKSGETATFTFRAWDQTTGQSSTGSSRQTANATSNGGGTAFSSAAAQVSLTVTDINDQPVFVGNPAITAISEEDINGPGQLISSILGTSATDADPGTQLGVLILSASNTTNWEYSMDAGASWSAVGAVSGGSALPLRATDLLRYQPNRQNGGSASMVIRAWDQSSGTAGTKAAPSGSSYTVAIKSLLLTINSINDAPVISGTSYSLAGTNEDTPSSSTTVSTVLTGVSGSDVDNLALSGIAASGVTGNGSWQYSTDGTTWTNFGTVSANAALLLTGTSQIRFNPNQVNGSTATVTFRAWDRTGGTASVNGIPSYGDTGTNGGITPYSATAAEATMSVAEVNDAPAITSFSGTVSPAIVPLSKTENQTTVATLTAIDDSGPLTWSVSGGADAALFTVSSSGELSFAGIPDFERPADAGENNVYDVTIRVSDGSLFMEQVFAITLTDVDDTAPAVPSGLAAIAGNTQIILNWTANAENDLSGYHVFGGTNALPATLLGTVPAGTTSYTQTGLANGTRYYYRITADDNIGNVSAPTTDVSAVPKAGQTITFNAPEVKTYGDAAITLGNASSSAGLTVTYTAADPAIVSISGNTATILKAGVTTITATQAGNDYFNAAPDKTQTLTVNTLAISVTAAAKNKDYGNTDPALTYTFSPALVGSDTFSGALSRSPGEGVGNYGILSGTLALSSSYTLSYTGANLAIGTKTITVTADAKTKTYGDADPALTYTFSPALVTGDSFSGALSRASGENIGNYAISQGTLALSGNYVLDYAGANLAIGTKTITVTADAKTKTYGNADPALTYTFSPALVTGDGFSGALSRASGENIGNYAISQGMLALSGNYVLDYAGANLAIGTKTIMVAADAKTKTYGDADPALTYTFSPALVTGDSFNGALSRASGENIGSYAISQGTLSLPSNYVIAYNSADLTIGTKKITVTAVAENKIYGDTDPALAYTFVPELVTGDAFTGTLTRAAGENVGNYTIGKGTLALSNQYILSYVPASLTIAPKTLTITAHNVTKIEGQALSGGEGSQAFSSSGPAFADHIGSVTLTYGAGAVAEAPAATYPGAVVASAATGENFPESNYSINYLPGDIIVNPRPPAISIAGNLLDFTACKGEVSPAQSLALSGENLVSAVVVTAPAGFEISTNAHDGYNSTMTLLPDNGRVSVTVYVRITASASGTSSGAITCASTGAGTKSVDVTGTTLVVPIPVISAGGPVSFCSGGQVVLTSSATTGNQWYKDGFPLPAATGRAYTATSSGNYTVAVSNTSGCSAASDAITVTVAPLPAATIANGFVVILDADGSAVLSANTGTGFTYQWYKDAVIVNGQAGSTLQVTGPGSYTVQVTNATGCGTMSSPSAVTALPAALASGSTSFCEGGSVNITVNLAPGQDVIRWKDANGRTVGGSGAIFTATTSGSYSAEINTPAGTRSTLPVTVTVYALPEAIITSSVNPASICAGETVTLIARNGGSAYQWYLDGNAITGATRAIYEAGAAGSYSVKVTNETGCFSISEPMAVTVNALPVIAVQAVPAITTSQTSFIIISRQLAGEADHYSLTAVSSMPGFAAITNAPFLNASSISVPVPASAPGSYTFNLVVSNSKSGCSSVAVPVVLTVYQPVSNNAYLSRLSISTGSLQPSFSQLISSYTVTVPYTTSSAFVTPVAAQPTATITVNDDAVSSGSNSRDFQLNEGTNLVEAAVTAQDGITRRKYTVTITRLAPEINTQSITFNPLPSMKYGDADFDPAAVASSGLAVGYVSSNTSVATVISGKIHIVGAGIAAITASQAGNSTYAPAIPVNMTLTVNPKAINVTAAAKTKIYGDSDPALAFTFSPALVTGDTFTGTLSRVAGENAGDYAISQGTLALSSNYTISFQPSALSIGRKTLTVTADNQSKVQGTANPVLTIASITGFANGQTDAVLSARPVLATTAVMSSLAGTYPIVPSGAVALNYSFVYVNGTLTVSPDTPSGITLTSAVLFENRPAGSLAGTLSSSAVDPGSVFTYSLVPGAGSTDNALFSVSGSRLVSAASFDFETRPIYALRIRTTNQYGQFFEKTFTVTVSDVNEPPTLDPIGSQVICFTPLPQPIQLTGFTPGPDGGQAVTLSISTLNPAMFSRLSIGTLFTNLTGITFQLAPGASGMATITVTATDNGGTANGGINALSRTFTITVDPLPVISITSSRTDSISLGDVAVLTGTAPGAVSYSWTGPGTILSGQNSNVLTVRPDFKGAATYTLRATNASGCYEEKTFTLGVKEDFVNVNEQGTNNIMSPNADGSNDKWVVKNIELYPNNEVKVFDRAGRIVFSKKGYTNTWDATLNGSPLAGDTYYYIVDFGPGLKKIKGFISIVRD